MDEKLGLAKALARVLEAVEEEGYCEGWDRAFDLGRSSGSTDAAYEFVDWIVTAYDRTLARLELGKEMKRFDKEFHLWLEELTDIVPFEIDWTNKKPVFPDDDEEEDL